MGTRFNRLEFARQAFINAGIQPSTLPAGNKIRSYDAWRNDPDNRELPDNTQPLRGTSDTASVAPFSFPDGINNRILVDISGRILQSLGVLTNLDGFNLITTNPQGIQRPSFVPATAVLAVKRQTGAVTTETSRITGRRYRRTTGTSFTIPFGKEDASDTQFSVMDNIIATRGQDFSLNFRFESLNR